MDNDTIQKALNAFALGLKVTTTDECIGITLGAMFDSMRDAVQNGTQNPAALIEFSCEDGERISIQYMPVDLLDMLEKNRGADEKPS